ncbi:hypothetical protein ACGK9U_10710 [Mariniflexile sp. HNIBRBA6329]|uniref:hypothetical protein n=1 Tax=Mariniflexile sp. HNIBRBA6329 TaxID=3373088 RepID=UPI003746EF7D
MMKHYKLLALILLSVSSMGYAQKGKLFGEINYNTFSHNDLKSFQEELISDFTEIQLVKNDNFPGNIGFTVGYTINDINTSIFASYTSTGGKASYSDYSGIIRLTEAIYGITLGGEYLINLNGNNNTKGDFNLGLRGLVTFSNMEIESYGDLSDQIESDSIEFSSVDFGGGLRIIYEYPISFFNLRLSLGFDVVIGGKYKFKEDSEYHLEDKNGDAVKNGWTGLRSGIGISIPL